MTVPPAGLSPKIGVTEVRVRGTLIVLDVTTGMIPKLSVTTGYQTPASAAILQVIVVEAVTVIP